MRLENDHLVLDWPYDKAEVSRMKLIPGAKWDRVGRAWRVPVTSLAETRDFAAEIGLSIDPEVLKLDLPVHKNPAFGVRMEGKYVYLSFGYDPVKVRSVKQIPGVTWDAKTKAWKAPISSIDQAITWAERFRMHVPDDVREEAGTIKSRMEAALAESRSTGAEIAIAGFEKLMPYQKAGVMYARNRRRCFIADEMGLGKTLQAIAAVEEMHRETDVYPVAVVCPANLTLNWAKEYSKWLPERRVAVVSGRKSFPEHGTYDVVVVGYPNLTAWQAQLTGLGGYVFDESHYLKTYTAQRTKAALKICRRASNSAPILLLTGTPVASRPAEYVSQIDMLGILDSFGGRMGFWRRYCNAHRDKYGQLRIDGHSNLEELNSTLRSTCYIRRTKDQVLSELPPVFESTVYFEGSEKGKRDYDVAEADVGAWLEQNGRSGNAPEQLARISVLRRLAAEAKLPGVMELIDEMVVAGQKVVVAAHHRDVVDAIATRYGGLKIQGGMSVADVEEAKRRFQENSVEDSPVIALSIEAAKTGHTLTAAQDIIFVELPWTPADVQQTYSRLHRIGQRGSVRVTYALLAGSIDEDIHQAISRKEEVVAGAVDGGDVVDSVRQRVASRLSSSREAKP
ncbi:MAG: DEAD/DEAH box helicase [Actinobacteria bacterium]|nr:DEAD/DEAH box helicase [Actinomycetota bacterium]